MIATARLEHVSDTLYAVVIAALVISIGIPDILNPTDTKLLAALERLIPHSITYLMSVAIISMFWISHRALYAACTTTINTRLALLNVAYLALVALLPFSSHFLGTYFQSSVAVLVYGGTVLSIGILASIVLQYAYASRQVDVSRFLHTPLVHARIRSLLTPACTLLGMSLIGVSHTLALMLYVCPILFIIAPTLLHPLERALRKAA